MTVHRHLHLTESADQALLWWMEEFYRPYGGEYVWTDGAALVEFLDRAGIDVALAHGSRYKADDYHPRLPSEH